jgi:hypothetical protein
VLYWGGEQCVPFSKTRRLDKEEGAKR